MIGIPIRLRLTVAFASTMLVVLVLASAFVHARLRADLDDSVDATLDARLLAAAELWTSTGSLAGFPLEDPEEGFVQVLGTDGELLDAVGTATAPALHHPYLSPGRDAIERNVPAIDGTARIRTSAAADGSGATVVVGQSLGNRDEALADLRASFLLGGPSAVAVASIAGYWLARAGLSPVESIRASAAALSSSSDGGRLPVPATRDEIQRLAETLNAMLERLEVAFERERRFVADASHELRTPIAVVKTELEGILLHGGHDPAATEALGAAVAECDSLAQLAEDLLVIARTGDGGLPLSRELTDARELLGRVRDRFVDRATRDGRSIDVEVPAPVSMSVDPGRIRQAISNLVDNALRHGRGTIILRATDDGACTSLSVTDEGVGFGADIIDVAFDRFARGSATRSTEGSGLGLSIVQTLANAHGGHTCIDPWPPTTIRISLPAGQPHGG